MAAPKRLLLTGGGTAGHVNPALAIGASLAGPETRTLFVGVKGRAEEKVVPREGIPLRFVRASGFPGARPSPALFRFAFDLAVGTLQAAGLLLRFRPDVIVGTGGYASAPVIFAAAFLRKLRLSRSRVYLHEQNAVPGKLNALAGRLARNAFVTFPQTLEQFPGNGVVSGYPLRRRIGSVEREAARAGLDFPVPAGRTVVFAFGGSLGARTVNRALVDALRHLLPHRDRLFVVHGTGLTRGAGYDAAEDTRARIEETYSEEERTRIGEFYVSRTYFHDIERVYAVTDLAVVRAGSGTLNELVTVGLPAIVVPKANLPGDHQVANARALARAGGAEVLYEETVLEEGHILERLDGKLLAERILALADDPKRRSAMAQAGRRALSRDALAVIARTIETGETPPRAAALEGEEEAIHLPSNAGLLAMLERAAATAGPSFRPEDAVPDPREIGYFRSRAASLLVDFDWESRNLGVKLLGLLGACDRVPLIVALLKDRTPAPLLQRLCGGDFAQVGFVRRNALTALGRLGCVTPDVEEVLLAAFDDPYFEARAEAARVAARLGGRLTRLREVSEALAKGTRDRDLEAACACAEALGAAGDGAVALPALLAMRSERYWRLRASALKGLLSLVERGEVADLPALARELPSFPLVSTDFAPQFELKATYRRLVEAVSSGQEGPR